MKCSVCKVTGAISLNDSVRCLSGTYVKDSEVIDRADSENSVHNTPRVTATSLRSVPSAHSTGTAAVGRSAFSGKLSTLSKLAEME